MPRAFRRARRSRAFLAFLLLASVSPGCVSLSLIETTRAFPARRWPDAPTIAIAEARDRRPDPELLGRVGWNSLKITGDAGAKFRNSLMTSINEHAYNVRFVGNVNVLDPSAVAAAVRQANADFLLTAAVLDIRAFSVDPFFDPADVDFTAQVNLLDPEGRTRYTRHIHVHEVKRLWFNPAFGARDMLDREMDRVADFVATDTELVRVVSEPRRAGPEAAARAPAAPSERPISSTETPPPPAGPATTTPLSEIPEAPPEGGPGTPAAPEATAPLPGESPPAEAAPPPGVQAPGQAPPSEAVQPPEMAPPPEATAPGTPAPPEVNPPEGTAVPEEPSPPSEAQPPPDEAPPGAASSPQEAAPAPSPPEEPQPGAIAPGEEVVPPAGGRDPVFSEPGAAP